MHRRSSDSLPSAPRAVPTLLENLERRVLLSGPSPREQEMLALTNRLRTHPAQELPLLLNSSDPDVNGALFYFNVNQQVLAQQWKSLTPVAPLAWNDALARASLSHNQRMLAAQSQGHQLPGEPTLIQRAAAAGYANAAFVGENVFAWVHSIFHAHAAFAIDWGAATNGIQNPPGHRDNLMTGLYREVGISAIDAPAGKSVGPILITQNFGVRRDQANPFLLGSVFDDKNRNGSYNAGEGLPNITIIASGKTGVFSTVSMTAGGYQMMLPSGTYTLTAAGAGGTASLGTVTLGQENVLRDVLKSSFRADTAAPTATFKIVTAPAPGQYTATFSIAYSDTGAINFATLNSGDLRITGPNGLSISPALVAVDRRLNAPVLTATYRMTAPGGVWDSIDNGTYTVSLQPQQVADVNGIYAPARTLGTFNVNAPPVLLTSGGLLVVNGTAGNDSIALWRNSVSIFAKVNATTVTFPYSAVRRITVSGLAGDDNILLGRNLMGSIIDGGLGNDTISGTDGADTIYGQAGDDSLIGYGGNDVFHSGPGRDTLQGGPGYDTADKDPSDLLSDVEIIAA